MNKKLIVTTMVCVSIFLTGCASNSMDSNKMNSSAMGGSKMETGMQAEYVKITPEKAKAMMTENPKAIILDVRTPAEYAERHIPGAKLVPNEDITDKEIEGLSKDDTILVYCRSGNRSRQASQKLLKMGYKHIYDFGGITSWPYETEPGAYKGM